jgi:hypothetical protein
VKLIDGGVDVALGEGVGLRKFCALSFGVLEVGEEEDLLVGEGGNEVGLVAIDALLASDLTCDRAQAAQVKKWVRGSLEYQ